MDVLTPCMNIVITTGRVQIGLVDQFQLRIVTATGKTVGLVEGSLMTHMCC